MEITYVCFGLIEWDRNSFQGSPSFYRSVNRVNYEPWIGRFHSQQVHVHRKEVKNSDFLFFQCATWWMREMNRCWFQSDFSINDFVIQIHRRIFIQGTNLQEIIPRTPSWLRRVETDWNHNSLLSMQFYRFF